MSEEKKFIVTETGFGERVIEKRFAGAWEVGDFGVLKITRDGLLTAQYQQHAWHSVRDEDATPPDGTAIALGIAKKALEAIMRISDPNVAIKLADDALGEMFAETDL